MTVPQLEQFQEKYDLICFFEMKARVFIPRLENADLGTTTSSSVHFGVG